MKLASLKMQNPFFFSKVSFHKENLEVNNFYLVLKIIGEFYFSLKYKIKFVIKQFISFASPFFKL